MEVIPGDTIISESIRKYGEWAQAEMDFLGDLIRPGDHVYDVGANIGTHTLAFARVAEAVTAFEPRIELYEILLRNVTKHNALRNVVLENYGLGNTHARINVERLDLAHSANFGALELVKVAASATNFNGIEIRTIDSYHPARLDLIKLDVEGMENEVLEGGIDTIRKHLPIVFVECNCMQGAVPILNFAKTHNYDVFGWSALAYNPNNYNKCTENIFSRAKETALLLYPRVKNSQLSEDLRDRIFGRIDSADDLVRLLLDKPQYPHEILANTNLGRRHGIEFTSPLSNRLQTTIATIEDRLKIENQRQEVEDVKAAQGIAEMGKRLAVQDISISSLIEAISKRDQEMATINTKHAKQLELQLSYLESILTIVNDQRSWPADITNLISERHGSIKTLLTETAKKVEVQLDSLVAAFSRQTTLVEVLANTIAERERTIASIKVEDSRIIESNQQTIDSLYETLEEKEKVNSLLRESICEKEGAIAALSKECDQRLAALQKIQVSLSWKCTAPLRALARLAE